MTTPSAKPLSVGPGKAAAPSGKAPDASPPTPTTQPQGEAPKAADRWEGGEKSSANAAAPAAAKPAESEGDLKPLFASWQKLRGDAHRQLSGMDLMREVGAALGVVPNHAPSSPQDEAQLQQGAWPLYEGKQLKAITVVSDAIRAAAGGKDPVSVGVMPFSYTPEGGSSQAVMPLFRVEGDGGQKWVDGSGRTYGSFDAWRAENALPAGQVTYPRSGLLGGPNGEASELVTENTPAVRDTVGENLLFAGDVAAVVGGIALGTAAVVGTGGLALLVGGAALSVYSAGRAGYGLYDAASHGESVALTDPKARAQWLTVAASTLGVGAVGSSLRAANAIAATGRIGGGLGGLAPELMVASQVAGTALVADQSVMLAQHWNELSPMDKALAISQIVFFGGAAARQSIALGSVTAPYNPAAIRRGLTPLDADVAVVGYGFGGAGAANEVVKAGRTVQVLEAQDRIGGRAFTSDKTGLSEPVDLGASWLHSMEKNPLSKVAAAAGIKLHETNQQGPIFTEKGRVSPAGEAAFAKTYETYETVMERNAQTADLPADAGVPRGLPFDSLARATIGELDMGASLNKLSGRDTAWQTMTGHDGLPDGGMKAVFDAYTAPHRAEVPISLNTPVKMVNRGPDGVELQTADGNSIFARRGVVTTSTGVLNAGDIGFSPALPAKTADAIRALPMGDFNKVYLEFNANLFGPETNHIPSYAPTDGSPPIIFLARPQGQNLVMAMIGGEKSVELSTMPKEASVAYVMSALRNMYGDKVDGALKGSYVTNWRQDPYAKGSYSHAEPGQTSARWDLAQPVDDRLMFAGEAVGTSKANPAEWAQQVAGAAMSGENAGRTMVQSIEQELLLNPGGPVRVGRDQIPGRAMRPGLSTIGAAAAEPPKDESPE